MQIVNGIVIVGIFSSVWIFGERFTVIVFSFKSSPMCFGK